MPRGVSASRCTTQAPRHTTQNQGLLSEQPPRHTHQFNRNSFRVRRRVQMNSTSLRRNRMLAINELSPCSYNKE